MCLGSNDAPQAVNNGRNDLRLATADERLGGFTRERRRPRARLELDSSGSQNSFPQAGHIAAGTTIL